MENHDFSVKPIGIIRTPHKIPSETPIQPVFSQGIRGSVLDDAKIRGRREFDG